MAYNKETGMYEGYIYKIYNDINDKVYIGQTIKTIKERWTQHKSATRNRADNFALHNAMYKYDISSFYIECIEILHAYNIEDLCVLLNEKEIFYIDKYKSVIPNGYNIAGGGNGVRGVNCKEIISCNPYTKEMQFYVSINQAAIENNVAASNIIACCQNKKYSTVGKIFKYKEDGISEEDIKKYFEEHPIIIQYDLNGNKLNTFLSSLEAAKYLKKNDSLNQTMAVISQNIMACCRGSRQTAYRYVWRKLDDSFDKYSLSINYPRKTEKDTTRPIDVYSINGIFVDSFPDIKAAFKSLGLVGKQTNQALRCCNGKAVMAFNYVWRFQGESFNKYSCAIINGSIRVNKYTQDGIFVNTYNNYKDAADSVGTTNRKAIADCCKGINHSYRGYLWFYINDVEQPEKSKIIN